MTDPIPTPPTKAHQICLNLATAAEISGVDMCTPIYPMLAPLYLAVVAFVMNKWFLVKGYGPGGRSRRVH